MFNRIKGLVSVVVTNYNKGEYLEECLDGIAGQTYSNWELILVDDASTDSSMDIARRWLEKQEPERKAGRSIVLLQLPRNIGYAGASTTGMFLAGGEYIAVHDSDDISHPERLAKQVEYLESHPDIEMLGTNYEVIDRWGKPGSRAGWIRYGDQIRKVYQNGGHCICHGTLMIRGTLFDRTGGHNRSVPGAEDYDFIARRLQQKVANADNLPQPLYFYRQHPEQRSRAYYGRGRGGSNGT